MDSPVFKKDKLLTANTLNIPKTTANLSKPLPQAKIAQAPSTAIGTIIKPPSPTPTLNIGQLAGNQSNKSLQPTADQLARQKLANENIQFQPASVSQPKMATLINPDTKDRQAVPVGSQDAQKLFGSGYILEGQKTQPLPQVQTASLPANQPQTPAQPQQQQVDKIQEQINQLQDLISTSSAPSAYQRSVQQKLDDLINGTNINAANLEGQGRGLTASQVTGQQGALFRAAAAAQAPLQSELNRLEADRQAALASGNQQLALVLQQQKDEMARQDQSQQQLQSLALQAAQSGATPEEIKGILASTSFGQALAGAGKFLQQSNDVKPVVLSEGQRLVNPVTGETIIDMAKTTTSELNDLLSVSEAQALGVPYGTTKGEAFGITGPGKEQTAEKIKLEANVKSALDSLQTIRQFSKERLGTGSLLNNQYKAAETNLVDVIGRLRSGGAITEDEQKSFSDLLPKTFETEATRQFKLDKIEQLLNDTLNTQSSVADDPLGLGFKTDLSKSLKGSDVKGIANAIAQVESSGNYKAIGPTTEKGNKAYGKYQIMDFNIPTWTKQALGTSLTPEQFLNDPIAQDITAEYKMSEIFKKHGNAADVASVWFSGRPLTKAGNSADVTGTTVPTYVQRVLKNLS